MIEFLRNDFQHLVSYTYDTEYSCETSCCYEEGLCRCGVITNIKINYIDISKLTNEIYSDIFSNTLSTKRNNKINSLWGISSEIEKYTIDRILRIFNVWKSENWQITICNGYYGQEIEEIKLKEEILVKLSDKIEQHLLVDDLSERVEGLLILENGFLIDSIKDCDYYVDTISIDSIIFPNKEHKSNIIIDGLHHYSDKEYSGIRGIVKKNGTNFKVIDGYHRLVKTENNKVRVLICSQTLK